MVSSSMIAVFVATLCLAIAIHGEPSSSAADPAFIALPSERANGPSVSAPVRVAGHFATVESVKGWLASTKGWLPRLGRGKTAKPAHIIATNTASTTASAVVEDGPKPPPEAMLVGKLLRAVGSDLEGFYNHEVEAGKGCIECVEQETEYLLTSLAKKVDGFCGNESGFDKFCGFYAEFRNLTVLALLSKLEVNPISLALTRCSLYDACAAPKAEADLVQRHLHQVEKITRIHFSSADAGRKLGPQEVPSEGCAQRHLAHLVKQEVEAGLALTGSSDVSICKECIKHGLHLYGVILVRKIQQICANPKCSKVEAWCNFGSEHQYLSKTALLLKLKPWEKVIKTCGRLQFCWRPRASVPATLQMHLLPPAPIFRFDAFEWQPAPAAIPVLQILHVVHNVESSLPSDVLRRMVEQAQRARIVEQRWYQIVELATMPKKMSFLQRLMHPWGREVEPLGHTHKHGFSFRQLEDDTGLPVSIAHLFGEDVEHEHSHRHHHAHGSHGFGQLQEIGEFEHPHGHHHAHGSHGIQHLQARAMLLSGEGEEHDNEHQEHEAHEHGRQHGHGHMHMDRHEMDNNDDRIVSILNFHPVHATKHGLRIQGFPAQFEEDEQDINSVDTEKPLDGAKPEHKTNEVKEEHKHKHEEHHDEEDVPLSQLAVLRHKLTGATLEEKIVNSVAMVVPTRAIRHKCQKGRKDATSNVIQPDSIAHITAQGRPNLHSYALRRQESSQKVAEDSEPLEPLPIPESSVLKLLPAAEDEQVPLPVMLEQSIVEGEKPRLFAVRTEEVKSDWNAFAVKLTKVVKVPEGLTKKVASFFGA